MKTKSEVIEYLKKKKLYDVMKRKMPVPIESYIANTRDLQDVLVGAFNWDYSKEGREFWNKANKEYLQFLGPVKEVDETFIGRRKYRKMSDVQANETLIRQCDEYEFQ